MLSTRWWRTAAESAAVCSRRACRWGCGWGGVELVTQCRPTLLFVCRSMTCGPDLQYCLCGEWGSVQFVIAPCEAACSR